MRPHRAFARLALLLLLLLSLGAADEAIVGADGTAAAVAATATPAAESDGAASSTDAEEPPPQPDLSQESTAEAPAAAAPGSQETRGPSGPAAPIEDTTTTSSSSSAAAANANATTEAAAPSEGSLPLSSQTGPLVDLFGPQLLSLEMVDETHAQLVPHATNQALRGKQVIGVYFSADWCGPCRQFTPELLAFYRKMNARKGLQDQFQIVWVSRCRDMNGYGQYFAQMPGWLALPPQEAMGQRGQWLGDKYRVKSIPTLVLLDDLGQVITTDARNKIPADKAGIGFPWRNPIANIYLTLVPRSVRFMIKSQLASVKDKLLDKVRSVLQARTVAQ